MYTLFKNRLDAGQKLAQLLKKYATEDTIIYALPRGGVEIAKPIASALKAPMDLLFARKIGHPLSQEYAIGAISESGHLVGGDELFSYGEKWLNEQKMRQIEEIKRRRLLYLQNRPPLDPKNKIAILVDDGVATGLTMEAGILELKSLHPKKIVVAVPVAPKDTFDRLKAMVDDAVGIEITSDFMGAVGAYYQEFPQVEDGKVINALKIDILM